MKDSSVALRGRARVTHEALLDAFEQQVGARGFDGVTSTGVAAAAGVSTGTFYTYFTDKHAALGELFARRLDELVAAVETVLTADHLLDLGLAATMEQVVEEVVSGYRGHAGALRAALGRVPADPRLRAVYWDRHAQAVAVAERFIRRGTAAGKVRSDAAPRVLAHTLLVLVQSLHHPVVLHPEEPALVEGLCAQVARTLTLLLAPTTAETAA